MQECGIKAIIFSRLHAIEPRDRGVTLAYEELYIYIINKSLNEKRKCESSGRWGWFEAEHEALRTTE